MFRHITFFSEVANRLFIDDLLIPGPSDEIVDSLVDYGETLLKIISYHIKDVDRAGQEFRSDTKTLDSQGKLSICGYSWLPNTNEIG